MSLVHTWWEVWLVVVAGVTAAAVAPLLVGRSRRTRSLTAAERAALAEAGVPPERVRVLASDHVGAFAAGLTPHSGRVFLTDRLASELSPAEFAAVACHEYGHLARRHVPLRLGLPVAFAAAWVAATTTLPVSSFVVGVALLVPTVLGSWLVSRWSEFDADRFAGRNAGSGRLADALARLARAGHLGGGGRFSRHPRLASRLDRLGGTSDDRSGGTRDDPPTPGVGSHPTGEAQED